MDPTCGTPCPPARGPELVDVVRRRRDDIVTTGFDEALQLNGGDSSAGMVNTGLRVPPLASPNMSVPGWYRFLCVVVDLTAGDALIGWDRLVTIGATRTSEERPRYLYERPVVTPNFYIPGGFVTFSLTVQPRAPTQRLVGPLDRPSFVLRDTDDCALVYESSHFPVAPPLPGYLGMDDYAPPAMQGSLVFSARDVRMLWQPDHFHALYLPVTQTTRYRLYADVFQPDSAETFVPNIDATWACGFTPEEQFLQQFNDAIYWRVAGRLIVERGVR